MTATVRPPAHSNLRVPGEPGVWVALVAEMFVFTILFGVIAYYHRQTPELFGAAQQLLSKPLGLINTLVLIGGSVIVVHAIAATENLRYRAASRLLSAAIGCGALFTIIKATEYALVLHHGATFYTNTFWMLFFAITGAHLMHVFVGMTALGLARRTVKLGLAGPRHRALLVSATCYWHLVDLLWLILFPLFYLVN